MKSVLYPGSFDPITKGHINVIEQASNLFDEVVVAVMKNSAKKNSFFTLEERVKLIEEIFKNDERIKVVTGEGAAVRLAQLYKCRAIIRGLRGVTDFDYEIQLSAINRKISDGEINTVCLFPSSDVQHISSSVVKEIYSIDEDVSEYVTDNVKHAMQKKYPR